MTKQGGGFTRNGEDFAGGEVQSENGSTYELALVDGRWVATYLPPEPVALELGTSGTSVSIRRTETGEHRIGELVLADGITLRADNGQAYRLSRIDGDWVADHVLPDPVEVRLGASGTAATLQQIEDLTWRIAEGVRERPFHSGDLVRTETGSSYRLVLADGRWTASFGPLRTEIALGESGASVVATQAENGGYLLGAAMLAEGHEYLHEASGNTYVFSRQSDGRWTASFKPLEQTLRLGPSGTVTLARSEDGTWWHGDRLVEDGAALTAPAGPTYQLALADGRWTASFVPEQTEIAGTGLVALSTESGRGYRVGESATLPESGEGDVEVGGALYHVWRENGDLRGIRFDREPYGESAGDGNFHLGLDSGAARLGEDKPDTPQNEAGTTLLVAGHEFSLGELLSTGSATVTGPLISESVATRIARLREQAEVLVEVLDQDQALLRAELRRIWDRAQTAVDRIFGPGEITLKRELGTASVVAALQAVETAMSSETAFEEATAEGLRGLFREAALGPGEAAEVFGAFEWTAQAVLGAAGGTRYGAVQKMVRRDGIADASLVLDAAGGEFGAFAYSTMADTPRTGDISHAGTAGYAGGVAAVSGAGRLYTGEIELLVNFTHDTVRGVVSNLADTEGRPWWYQLQEVDQIVLPDASLRRGAIWSRTGMLEAGAQIQYRSLIRSPEFVTSTFTGHLLGRGEAAGSEAVGVWSVGEEALRGSYLMGGFGATRRELRIQPSQGPVREAGARAYSVQPSDNPDLGGAAAASATLTTWGTQPSWDLAAPPAGLDAPSLVDVTGNHIANPSALSKRDGLGIVSRGEQRGQH